MAVVMSSQDLRSGHVTICRCTNCNTRAALIAPTDSALWIGVERHVLHGEHIMSLVRYKHDISSERILYMVRRLRADFAA